MDNNKRGCFVIGFWLRWLNWPFNPAAYICVLDTPSHFVGSKRYCCWYLKVLSQVSSEWIGSFPMGKCALYCRTSGLSNRPSYLMFLSGEPYSTAWNMSPYSQDKYCHLSFVATQEDKRLQFLWGGVHWKEKQLTLKPCCCYYDHMNDMCVFWFILRTFPFNTYVCQKKTTTENAHF